MTRVPILKQYGVWGTNLKLKHKRHSINRQIVGATVGILSFTIISLWIINTCFLGDFYLKEKKQAMESAFQMVNDAAANDQLEEEDFLLKLERSHANHNIAVVVMNSSGKILLSTIPETRDLFAQFLSATFQQGSMSEEDVLAHDGNYVVFKQVDKRFNEEYLILCGTLDDGNLIMMRSAVESIHESTKLTNRFLLYFGVISLMIGVASAIVLTKRITKPLLDLTELSKRMAKLDFNAKYVSQEKSNEVDVLGDAMNELSEALEKNILELKQANIELQADIAMKEARQKSQQDFVANVSHELKTPIAVIQGYAEGLAEGVTDDPESRAYYCDVIVDEAKKMNRMVLSLISLNQLESGNSEISFERFDIVEMAKGILASMQLLFEQEGVTVELEDVAECFVYADEIMVEQVLSNYLSNALHYAKGEKKVRLSFEKKEGKVRICVYNSGDTIPEESINQIWDKFYKVDKARTREYGGTGIGLSIVKAVMESLHQGYGVRNLEKGVEFWFELEC